MDSIGVLMMCPISTYLETQLSQKFNLFKFWTVPEKPAFLANHASSIRAVVGNSAVGADVELIDALPKLEIVSSFSVGLDKIDLNKCREMGIRVTNTPDVLTDCVADLAIGLILATLRRICESDRYVRSGSWKKGDFKLTTKFTGKSVGIIGLGRIGTAIAKRAEAFDCPISYYSRSQKSDINYKYYPNVIELASNCQILVVACPLTAETRHIVNREVINALGPKGVLINIGRGPHVDEPELVSALVEGRLGGAGLDVFEDEPHVPEELFKLENVVLLPHVGSGTVETRDAMADLVVGNLEAHFLKKPLLTPVVWRNLEEGSVKIYNSMGKSWFISLLLRFMLIHSTFFAECHFMCCCKLEPPSIIIIIQSLCAVHFWLFLLLDDLKFSCRLRRKDNQDQTG